MILKNAWRNIWRNKRRTLITASSVFFAVFFALLMRSVQLGTLYKMVDDTVDAYSGAVQVHAKGYWDEKTVNNSFLRDALMESKIFELVNVRAVVPRFESFALASSGPKTKGVMVIGIDPDVENAFSGIAKRVRLGEYLTDNEQAVLLGADLADYLGLQINDTVVLLGQGYQGVSAAGKYQIKGLVKFPNPKINKAMLFIPIGQAQMLYGAENRLTSLNIGLHNNLLSIHLSNKIKQNTNLEMYEIMPWEEMMVEFVQMIKTKNVSSTFMLALLYIIVGFGVLGTIIMMVSERMREFGILVAMGMKKRLLALIVIMETVLIGFLGLIAGAISSLPIIWYYAHNPIRIEGEMGQMYEEFGVEPVIKFMMEPTVFFNQTYVVLLIVLVSVIYPIAKIASINPVKAMRMN
jgi:ABC-type lipoprotein release transport system permease subunit